VVGLDVGVFRLLASILVKSYRGSSIMAESSNLSFMNKKVLIFGLGVLGGGVGAAEFFAKNGAVVKVTDLRSKDELSDSIERLSKYDISYILGKHTFSDFSWADLVIRNPSVPLKSSYLQYCFDNKIQVEMVDSLFCKLTKAKIIGVTGTRGKTTTATLIYKLLKTAGFNAYLAGNIPGKSSLELLDKAGRSSYVVLELSSWQLQAFGWSKISPSVSVVTNIYEDHLNRYKDASEYIEDKKNIVRYQNKSDIAFLNKDDKRVCEFEKVAGGKVEYYSKDDLRQKARAIKLIGEHNRENVAASVAVAGFLGVNKDIAAAVLGEFSGVAHRFSLVREISGVNFINDTTATTPVSVIKALESLPVRRVILIAGGNKKNLSIREMGKVIAKRAKAVVYLVGNGTDELRSLVRKEKRVKDLGVFSKMSRAVKMARTYAKMGDYVLLSPGFTSFAMYRNEFERGEDFCRVVKNIK